MAPSCACSSHLRLAHRQSDQRARAQTQVPCTLCAARRGAAHHGMLTRVSRRGGRKALVRIRFARLR